MKKKIGITADNYKLPKFKDSLEKAGFTDYEVKKFTNNTSIISINTTDDKIKEIAKVCELVQIHFKQSN